MTIYLYGKNLFSFSMITLTNLNLKDMNVMHCVVLFVWKFESLPGIFPTPYVGKDVFTAGLVMLLDCNIQ